MSLIRVVAFNGSPRPEGNTYHSLRIVLEELASAGIGGEIVQLGGKTLAGCKACFKCYKAKNMRCSQEDDEMNHFIGKAAAADGIIIGTPVYFVNVTTEVKAFIDRCGTVAHANKEMLKGKAGAAVIAMRRAGAMSAFATLNFFFSFCKITIPVGSQWNVGIGLKPGDVLQDQEGVAAFRALGQNMAALLKNSC
jgi:multimeric flavodoxin WrbA